MDPIDRRVVNLLRGLSFALVVTGVCIIWSAYRPLDNTLDTVGLVLAFTGWLLNEAADRME